MAGRKQYEVKLTETAQAELEAMTQRGRHAVREVKRAQVLLRLAAGETYACIAAQVAVSRSTVQNIAQRYRTGGVARALHEAPRPGQPRRFTGAQRAKVTALACSTPPDGHARWSLRMLADQVVELQIVETIHHDTVREILKKTT